MDPILSSLRVRPAPHTAPTCNGQEEQLGAAQACRDDRLGTAHACRHGGAITFTGALRGGTATAAAATTTTARAGRIAVAGAQRGQRQQLWAATSTSTAGAGGERWGGRAEEAMHLLRRYVLVEEDVEPEGA